MNALKHRKGNLKEEKRNKNCSGGDKLSRFLNEIKQ